MNATQTSEGEANVRKKDKISTKLLKWVSVGEH